MSNPSEFADRLKCCAQPERSSRVTEKKIETMTMIMRPEEAHGIGTDIVAGVAGGVASGVAGAVAQQVLGAIKPGNSKPEQPKK